MKALILAAGMGTRLGEAGQKKPKCLAEIAGISLLDRQIATMRHLGLNDISIVAGHQSDQIVAPSIRKFLNKRFRETNMVKSLFCAETLMLEKGDLVVSYGDIIYEPKVLKALMESSADVAVCIDRNWKPLWQLRMEDPLSDAETLKIDADGYLRELGRKPHSYDEIEGQYIGLMKFSGAILNKIQKTYTGLDKDKLYEGRSLDQMFMTTFLQLLIDSNYKVSPVFFEGGWLEIDSGDDLLLYNEMAKTGELCHFYNGV